MFSFTIKTPKLAPPSIPQEPAPVLKITPGILKAIKILDDREEQQRKAEARRRLGLVVMVVGTGAVTFGGAYFLAHRR